MLEEVSSNLFLIEGIPKQAPITTVQPKTPLTKGNKKFLPKLTLLLPFFSVFYVTLYEF